jgi:outer membrane protein TolC
MMIFHFLTKYFHKILLIICLTFSSLSFAENPEKNITEQDIITSVLNHYPKIFSFYEAVNYANNEILERQGFFDVKLKHSLSNRSRGFYDGVTGDTQISRSNKFLGSEVFAGYRKSTGSFPIYENGDLTNDHGEYYAGIKFSLLRNRSIDDPRLKLLLSRLDLQENKAQLEAVKNKIVEDALVSYWRWIASGNIYNLYQDLYQLALDRQVKMEVLFEKGDIAQIILVENERNILNRKRRLIEAQRSFENDSIYLSLFLRNNQGLPLQPAESQIIKINLTAKINPTSIENLNKDLNFALENRPDIMVLRIKAKKERQKIRQAENLNKPKFDISLKMSKDEGNGPGLRQDSENIIKAELSIPLQRRMTKGQIGKYTARLNDLKYQQQLLSEKVKIEIRQLKNSINRSIDIYQNIKREIELSDILQKSEVIKLKRGRSNFFLINLREQELFSARLALLQIYEKYQDFLIKYKSSSFRLLEN